METREVIYTGTDKNENIQTLAVGDKILRIDMRRRYRNATPTTTSDIERYPDGYEYDVEQQVKEIVGSRELEPLYGDGDPDTVIEFDDGSEMFADSIIDRLSAENRPVKDELDEHMLILEKF